MGMKLGDIERLSRLESLFRNFRVASVGAVSVVGMLHSGLAVNVAAETTSVGTGGGVTPIPGCTDPAALNYNPSATVDDGSCTYIGACCDGFTCSISSPGDCIGTYQGNNTTCDPNPCPLTCPSWTLACDSVSASLSKCGYTIGSDSPPTYYRSRSASFSGSAHSEEPCRNGHTQTTDENFSMSGASDSFNSDCTGFTSVRGDYTDVSENVECDGSSDSFTSHSTFDIASAMTFCASGEFGTTTVITTPTSITVTATNSVGICTAIKSLSDEYTTAELISNTEAAIPSYFGHQGCEEDEIIGFRTTGQGCVCFSQYELASDESSLTITRFKYQFKFGSSSNPFHLEWVERFTPDVGGPTDTPRIEYFGTGDTESSIYTVDEPGSNGTISIADVVCTADSP